MNAKHTPGPWGIMGRNVGTNPEDPIKWSGVASVSGYGPESDANLALVSAAPDLLDALERLASYGDVFQYRTGTRNPYEQALAAIAKARGEA